MKLEDPKAIRLAWIGFIACLVVLLLLDLVVEHHPHFGIDGYFGFSAWYGFGTCVLMVVGSKKLVGLFLKRKDTYYDD
ncbi:MAG: hypothetical protein V3V08_25350 [Nannocystaceae bacterium]